MLKLLTIALVLGLSSGSAAIAGSVKDARPIISRAVDGFVRPAYHKFRLATSALVQSSKSLCEKPSATTLESARSAFDDAVAAWSEVEPIRFGPVTEQNRLERILYWPDRKSIGLKQVQAALASKDPAATDAAGLAGKSVAMQGLGAMEYILFGTDADTLAGPADPHRCAYGAAVAANLDAMAGEIDAAWAAKDGFAALWEKPGAENALYRTSDEALGELLNVFVNGLEMVRDVRVRSFLGTAPDKDKPKQAVFWRSRQTAASLAANMAGMGRLFEVSRLGDALAPESRWIAESIGIQFANAVKTAQETDGPIDQVLSNSEGRARLEHFVLITSSLSQLLGTRLSGELGLTAGFSSLDGD